jgi:hypothetical protein
MQRIYSESLGKIVEVPALKDPIEQLPYLGMDRDEFEKEATALGYKCEILPHPKRGWVITMQVRREDQLIVDTNERGKVIRIQ